MKDTDIVLSRLVKARLEGDEFFYRVKKKLYRGVEYHWGCIVGPVEKKEQVLFKKKIDKEEFDAWDSEKNLFPVTGAWVVAYVGG